MTDKNHLIGRDDNSSFPPPISLNRSVVASQGEGAVLAPPSKSPSPSSSDRPFKTGAELLGYYNMDSIPYFNETINALSVVRSDLELLTEEQKTTVRKWIAKISEELEVVPRSIQDGDES